MCSILPSFAHKGFLGTDLELCAKGFEAFRLDPACVLDAFVVRGQYSEEDLTAYWRDAMATPGTAADKPPESKKEVA